MKKIKSIKFVDFKFFHDNYCLDIQRKNVLIYGENGSGKSSIYWGLHCFLNSAIKETEEIKKYFDHEDDKNIINIYSNDNNSKIEVNFADSLGKETNYTISYDLQNTRVAEIKESLKASDFLTYKLIFQIYNFKNSEIIDLFPLWESDLLENVYFDVHLRKVDGTIGTTNAKEWWNYIKNVIDKNDRTEILEFIGVVEKFNSSLKKYIYSIVENANRFLENFQYNFSINFEYSPCAIEKKRKGIVLRKYPEIRLIVKYNSSPINNNKMVINRPHVFLNEAKLASIALSIRFAMLKERLTDTEEAKILVIDDLLLSLDMSNRACVLKIILSEFADFQIIMLTHDKLFYEFTKNNIEIRDKEKWLFWEMSEIDAHNIPKPFIKNSKSYIESAEYYYYKNDYEIAGNFLRKETESFVKKLLPKKLQHGGDYSMLDLNGLIQRAIKLAEGCGLDLLLFKELDNYRQSILNPSSHDSYNVPKYKNEIFSCINILKKLSVIKVEPIFNRQDRLNFNLHDEEGNEFSLDIIIEDDFKQIKEPLKGSVISKGCINYYILKNGNVILEDGLEKLKGLRHENTNLESFYKKFYDKSNKKQSSDFWDEITHVKLNQKIKCLRIK